MKMKKELIFGMEKEFNKLMNVYVKPNKLQEQRFTMTIEDCIQKIFIYEDELTQTIGLSLIPQEIANKSN